MINTPFLDQTFARQQLLKYIADSLNTGYQVAVFAMYKDGSVRLIHDIANDPALLANALKGVAGTLSNSAANTKSVPPNSRRSTEDAVLSGNSPHKPTNASDPAVQQAVDEAESLAAFQDQTSGAGAFDLRRNMEATLACMRQIAQAYSGVPGRKPFVWITGSFPFDITGTGELISPQAYFVGYSQDPGRYSSTHSGALPPLPETAAVVSTSELNPLRQKFRVLLQQLAAYNIVVYPVDARGVMALDVDASDSYTNKLLTAMDQARSQTSRSTMATIARMTGGKSCYDRNDIANCVKEAGDDSEQYYLLSYYRDKKNNKPGWRTLTVKLDVPDAEVRARAGYFYGSDVSGKDAPLEELSAAARSTVPFTAIQFSARFTGASADGDKKQVKYEIYLPPESIRVVNDADGKFNLELVVVASTGEGSKNYSVGATLGKNLPAESYRNIQSQGLAYSNALSLFPGDYTVHFIVRDVTRNVVGSLIAPLRTDDPALNVQTSRKNIGTPVPARRRATAPELGANSLASTAWMPPDVDALKPSVAAGVECPADILEATVNSSKDLVDTIARFSAVEHVVHVDLSPEGTPKTHETREFDYVADITQNAQSLKIEEYREPIALDNLGGIKTKGLAALAIAFHPFFHDDFEMHCEGLGNWNGQAAWLVYFRQLENKPGRLRSYVVRGHYYPVLLKGRAWIGADNLQIVHLQTDLLHPIPEIQLMGEHTEVSYGPVEFKTRGADLWLPKSAELYVSFCKHNFHRSESFDNFKLFATNSAYDVKLPKSSPPESPTSDQGLAPPR